MQYRFDGEDYIPTRDDERLTGQLLRVWNVVMDGNWRTLREISDLTGDPEASVSAQLRHLRKERFGAHTVEREYVDKGLYKYRLIVNMDDMRKPIGLSVPYRKPKTENKKPWVGLTGEEVGRILGFSEHTVESTRITLICVAQAIEAKLKEKNNV